ncbi:MAG: hypothetical protein AABX07_05360 [Nanoarchaeota archaeon]
MRDIIKSSFVLIVLLISINFAIAVEPFMTSTSYVNPSVNMPSFESYYSGGKYVGFDTIWPNLNDRPETCEARQDLLLKIPNAGCQPAVVRSDLLAEQNVPVFCQIEAIKINPLVDISKIDTLTFDAKKPNEVAGVGFHPAKVALRTKDVLLGSPVTSNIGYVVVILKKNEIESSLPNFVNVNLTARVQYETENSLGVGRAEFIMSPQDDETWEKEKDKQSFWNGRYHLRLVRAEPDYADLNVYYGDRMVSNLRVQKGKISNPIYMPGGYCRVGIRAEYSGFISAEKKARIEVGSGDSVDVVDVYKGSTFLNGKCRVEAININNKTAIETGNLSIRCGPEQVILSLSIKFASFQDKAPKFDDKNNVTYIEFSKDEILGVDDNSQLVSPDKTNWKIVDLSAIADAKNKIELETLQKELVKYKELISKKEVKSETPSLTDKDKAFENAITAYEKVADDYSYEREKDFNGSVYYGEEALREAIALARTAGKEDVQARLINKFIDIYPNAGGLDSLKNELNKIAILDNSKSGKSVYLDNQYRTLRLVSLKVPEKRSSANLIIENKPMQLSLEERKDIPYLGSARNSNISIRLTSISIDKVSITPYCPNAMGVAQSQASVELKIGDSAGKMICNGILVKLDNIDLQKIAQVKLTPLTHGSGSIVNLSVNIGIEKRAIQLSPEKTKEKIDNLNQSIKKWESIVDGLGKVVSGLKAACLATSVVLTAKNFINGISGESIARQKVMRGDNGWTSRCRVFVEHKDYPTLDACYLAKSKEISQDVKAYTEAINKVNADIKATEELNKMNPGFLGEKSVNRDTSVNKYLTENIVRNYGEEDIIIGGKTKKIKEIFNNSNGYQDGEYSYEQLREIELNLIVKKQGSADSSKNADNELRKIGERITAVQQEISETKQKEGLKSIGGVPIVIKAKGAQEMGGDVFATSKLKPKVADALKVGNTPINNAVFIDVGTDNGNIKSGIYAVGLEKDLNGNYDIRSVAKVNNTGDLASESPINKEDFTKELSIGKIIPQKQLVYHNYYLNPQLKYFESGQYAKMPAVVPFDLQNGWYAATKQTLPVFGAGSTQGAFESSGRVSSFWLCNVGVNKIEQFEEGLGDDVCEQINTYTGQTLTFPGINNAQEVARLVKRAQDALKSAAEQYGQKPVKIEGQDIINVKTAMNTPSMQCQDFMTPKDCHILFNVCDPVICPPTRCNFGGSYQVADVIQSGIIGSSLLCLPNAREGIYVPVCLSGIHAGLDNYVSILKSHRDCLQESLATGKSVGICDQVYSIYMCEFFWKQAAPLANVLLPKIVEIAYGKSVARGGGEYLTVQGAWQSMQKSIDYFKSVYAVNAFKAFQIRSIEEAGTPFCKAFISAKAPTAFKSLIEPDSPPQYSAWFSSAKFTDATLPPTDSYKVFYHIYAGKDSGVSYRVYLKDPPMSSYYSSVSEWYVASRFIPRGEYATETKDFTAPSGYKQLCISVNGEEECGFKQVSSSFAVNYVRDVYVSDEMTRTDISSEKTCISGGTNVKSLLANTNPQSSVEEAAFPQDYNRGIVRICSTLNPGSSTDSLRFIEVGYCDNPKVKCWLDKKSVDNALTRNNLGVRNETLQKLETQQIEILKDSGAIEDPARISNNILPDFKKRLSALDLSNPSVFSQSAIKLIEDIETIAPKLFLNVQKAEIFLIKARVLGKIFEMYKFSDKTPAPSPPSMNALNPSAPSADASASAQPEAKKNEFSLDTQKFYSISAIHKILFNGDETGVSLNGGAVYYKDLEGSTKVGEVQKSDNLLGNYQIVLYPIGKEKLSQEYSDGINNAFISSSARSSEGNLLLVREENNEPNIKNDGSGIEIKDEQPD